MSNGIDEILARMKLRAMTAEEIAAHAAAEAQSAAGKATHRTMELRATWGAPKRHAERSALDRSGPWGATEKKLVPLLGGGLFVALIGGRGSGKTQLAVELMRETTRRQRSALYASAAEFFMAVTATYKNDSHETARDVVQRYQRPSLLVLDEFGRRTESKWENDLLFELLDKRYGAVKDTMLLSNQPKAELLDALGPSLASRMQETGGIIDATWGSYRA